MLFLIRQRIYNTRYYVSKDKRKAGKIQPQADTKDHEKLYQTLSTELKKRKANMETIKQIIGLTLNERRKFILGIEDADPSKLVVEKYPFMNNELAVSTIFLYWYTVNKRNAW